MSPDLIFSRHPAAAATRGRPDFRRRKFPYRGTTVVTFTGWRPVFPPWLTSIILISCFTSNCFASVRRLNCTAASPCLPGPSAGSMAADGRAVSIFCFCSWFFCWLFNWFFRDGTWKNASFASGAFATTISCLPSGPILSHTDGSTVTVTLSDPSAGPPDCLYGDCPWTTLQLKRNSSRTRPACMTIMMPQAYP